MRDHGSLIVLRDRPEVAIFCFETTKFYARNEVIIDLRKGHAAVITFFDDVARNWAASNTKRNSMPYARSSAVSTPCLTR